MTKGRSTAEGRGLTRAQLIQTLEPAFGEIRAAVDKATAALNDVCPRHLEEPLEQIRAHLSSVSQSIDAALPGECECCAEGCDCGCICDCERHRLDYCAAQEGPGCACLIAKERLPTSAGRSTPTREETP